MSGGDGFRDMERYGRKHEARLREFLELENGVPGHDTFRRVLSTLRPEAFGVCVRLWQRAAAGRLGRRGGGGRVGKPDNAIQPQAALWMERESRDVSAGRPTGWHGGVSEEPESRSPSSRNLWKFLT